MIRRLFIAVFFLGAVLPVRGQECHGGGHWELAANAGYMMTNNSAYSGANAFAYGADVTWWHRSFRDDYWRVRRGYPSFGVKFSYSRIPDGMAGDRFGLTGMLRRPLGGEWDFSLGLGLSAYTRPFSLTGDSSNLFIGSLVNCLIDLGVTYHATAHSLLHLSLLHTSNGMLYRPNQGLNYLQVGMGYWLTPLRKSRPVLSPEPPAHAESEFGMSLALGGVMSRDVRRSGYFGCYDLSLNFLHYLTPLFAVGGTLDFWYNFVDRYPSRLSGDIHTFPVYVSALACFEVFFGALSVRAGIGPSLITSSEVSIPFYERVGAYYNFGSGRHYAGVALNAHAGRIEFIEWTYGFRLRG